MSYQIAGEWSDSTGSFDLIDANLTLRMFDFALTSESVDSSPVSTTDSLTTRTQLTTKNYSVSSLTFGQGRGDGVEVFKNIDNWSLSASTTTVSTTLVESEKTTSQSVDPSGIILEMVLILAVGTLIILSR